MLKKVLRPTQHKLETWANAQRDGRPVEYRWYPLFNSAKFGWRPILECRAVTLPRRETRWNLQGCPKLRNRSQPLVGWSSPHCEDMCSRYCCLTSFFSDCRYVTAWQTCSALAVATSNSHQSRHRNTNIRNQWSCLYVTFDLPIAWHFTICTSSHSINTYFPHSLKPITSGPITSNKQQNPWQNIWDKSTWYAYRRCSLCCSLYVAISSSVNSTVTLPFGSNFGPE